MDASIELDYTAANNIETYETKLVSLYCLDMINNRQIYSNKWICHDLETLA